MIKMPIEIISMPMRLEEKIVDYVEIDKYAVKSYNVINGTSFEPQDITEWDKDVEVDFAMLIGLLITMTFSFYKHDYMPFICGCLYIIIVILIQNRMEG